MMNEPSINQTARGTSENAALGHTIKELEGHLVDAEGLRTELFKPGCEPSLAWVRRQTRVRAIPSIRVGRLIFYNPAAVREKLARKNTINAV